MKILKQLMATVNSDLFQPKSDEQKNLIQPTIATWKMTVRTLGFLALACLFLWSFFPILDKTYKVYRLPFLAWYPYSFKTSPQYEFTYLYQVLAIHFIAVVNLNIDSLIAALNMFVAAQFQILCDDLRNLHQADVSSIDVKKKLKSCINHHREILKFADHANEFYNWLLLVQFFVGGFSIGLAMFQLTVVSLAVHFAVILPLNCPFMKVVPLSSEFYSHVSYANAILVEVFMYCWFGHDIELKVNISIFE
ncbi:7tm 6 domain containing protein [Asbolus verrucosus]|uniref:7tm 6 domain containing protein n=1 Tax=Asbolus verrucosus TaxID=1661398 RepID=A0A482WBZ9_ASBVE|nr:7tm 6 domain containing protein [Asbolus verrucosus]